MWPTPTPLLSGTRLQCLSSPNPSLLKNVLYPAVGPNRLRIAVSARGKTGSAGPTDDTQQEPIKRGRKPKTTAAEPVDAEAATAAAAEPPTPKKRGRKTKAEIEQATQAADEAFTALGQDSDEEDEAKAAGEEGLAIAPSQGPGSWADAAATTAGEEDRRRFPYHRRIHTAAQDGNISGAESAFTSMAAAGLPPGPRAYHVLLCAYLKAGDVAGGLDVTRRATDAGVQLLPESYAALIFSYMELNPPDVTVAKTLYSAMAGTDTDQQLPWSVLCRLLSAKGFAPDTIAVVREGLAGGLEMDPDVAEAYIKALCSTQQPDAALRFLEDMQSQYGFRPEARHVNYVVEAEARAGNLTDAAGLMEASGIRGWGSNAGTFNGYLMGLVQQMGGLENPNADDELVSNFATLRSRMVQRGVRPDKITFKLEAEGFVELGDARSAMSAVTSMRNNAGSMGCRLLEPHSLAKLLQLLCDNDMPVDLLQLLVYMSEDSCRLPTEALEPDTEGRTLLSRWVVEHMEGIAARAEARGVADAMLASEIQLIDGYRIGPGRCVIDETGLVIPVSKCTIKELKAEAKARDIDEAEGMKRPELVQQIKTARSRLPFNVLKAQVMRDDSTTRKKAKPAAAKKKRRPRVYRDVWTIDPESGDADVAPAPRMYGEEDQYLLEDEQLEQIDVFDDQYGIKTFKDMQGVNFEAVMEARMLDEGAAAIMNVGDEDVATGFATLLPGQGEDEEEDLDEDEGKGKEADGKDWEKMARAADTELPGLQEGYQQLLMLQDKRLDTEEANLAAGMDIALDCVRAAEMLGGGCTAADVLVLQKAALAERSSSAAVAVAERLNVLLQPGAVDGGADVLGRQVVLRLYEELADMCLQLRSPPSADLVLEEAENAGLKPSEDLLSRLTVALRGRPRRSVRLQRENAGLLERAGLDVSAEEDFQQLQQQQQSSSSSAAQLPAAAAEPEVLDVQATAVVDQPEEKEGQSGAAEETVDEEVDDDTMHVMEILANIAEMNLQRETIGSTLEKTGLDHDQVLDILDDPVAMMVDNSWLPQAVLQRPESLDSMIPNSSTPGDEAEEDESEGQAAGQAAAAAAGGEGEEGEEAEEGEDEEDGMTLLELAHVAAEGSLTPEQNEQLLSVAERYQLPLMLDESTGQLIWPGTDEYEQWAAEGDNETLAQEDYVALGEAFESEFIDMAQRAEQWAETMMEHTVTEEGEEKELNPEIQEELDSLTAMFLSKMKSSGVLDIQEASEEEAPSVKFNKDALNFNTEAELQKLTEEWGPLVEATRREMEEQGIFEELRELGAPVEDLKLDKPRAGAAGSRLAGSSTSSTS